MKSEGPDAFWETLSLEQMSDQQWESLCDGCGRCCLLKLQDVETDETFYTRVSCRLLDLERCRCTDYKNRVTRVPECLQVRRMAQETYRWLPESCAYRRLAMGKGLAPWHPLITGEAHSVKNAGITVDAFGVSEEYIHPEQLEEHIITLSVD
ncbi:MAG TPA: YcgN family cysteine cluster protein [Gammaproteobacteria bacterium]|nr:YcgN family cysteine cluster protein [Gammaproteobacteria bacterium]